MTVESIQTTYIVYKPHTWYSNRFHYYGLFEHELRIYYWTLLRVKDVAQKHILNNHLV